MTVEVLTNNPYYVLRDVNCVTIGKRAIKGKKVSFDDEVAFFKSKFLAEHSTIECLQFRVVDDSCRGDVASHIVRTTKGLPRFQVQSSRPDWNDGEERKPLDKTTVIFSSVWNPLSWMQMCRQRLCNRAAVDTKLWVMAVLDEMRLSGCPMLVALEQCCIPQCVYRGNICYEEKPCGMCQHWRDLAK